MSTELKAENVNAKNAGIIFKERLRVLEMVQADDEFYAALLCKYRMDPISFINDWFVTYDPRYKPALMPFVLFPKQKEYIQWLRQRFDNQEDAVVVKTRRVGITYLSVAFAIWLWRFHLGSKIGFGSRKEMLVDRLGDPDSIFEKIRIILKYMPNEFLPPNFNLDRDCKYLKILNPQNDNTITGEAGDNIGRGGGNTIYFKDESAHYERADKIDASLSMNAEIKIDISTPNGTGNPYYRKCVSGEYPVFTFHWKDDPRLDEKWYEKFKRKYGPVITAREIDCSFTESMERIIIPTEWIEAAVDFRIPATGQKIIALDVADEGGDENAEIWRHGVVIPPGAIEHWSEGDTGATTRRVCFTCKQNNIKLFKYDNIGVGAGVKAEINNWNANPERKIDKFKIIPQGINFGASPTPGNFAPGKPNKEMFQNLKAQLWWECRRRFERTWKVKNRKAKYSSEQLCSIPNHPQLKLELAQPRYEFNENTGKLRVEKKEKMKGRGIASPNVADAFVVCFSRPIGLDLLLLTET